MHSSDLDAGSRKVLIAIAQRPDGADSTYIAQVTGYKSRTRTEYLGRLRRKGYIDGTREIRATREGVSALGTFEPLPTGADLLDHWLSKLTGGERTILDFVARSKGRFVSRSNIMADTGFAERTLTEYVGRLKRRRIVEAGRDGIRLSDELC